MKIRNGFISNSSSSSFILGFKGSEKELKEKLEKIFKFPENFPIIMEESIADLFMDKLEDCEMYKSWEEYVKNNYIEDDELDSQQEIIKEIFNKGMILYENVFYDDDCGLEEFLCNSKIKYEDNNLYISKEASY